MRIKLAAFLSLVFLTCVFCAAMGTRPGNCEPASGKTAVQEADPGVVVITLKNRGQIKGVIVEETGDGFVVDVGFGTVMLSRDEIETIETPGADEKDRILGEWNRHISSTGITEEERKRNAEAVRERTEESRRIKEEMAEWKRRENEHRIEFKDSSRMVVEAVLNEKLRMRLLVDTGASSVVIPLKWARRAMEIHPERADRVETRLADGSVRMGIPIVLKSLEVGSARAENVEAVTMEMHGESGLLGMSFLNRFRVRVDTEENILILKEN